MQNTNNDFEDFINFSMEKASRLFRQSEECRLLQEKCERTEQDLKVSFNADDYSYIGNCFKTMIQFMFLHLKQQCLAIKHKNISQK